MSTSRKHRPNFWLAHLITNQRKLHRVRQSHLYKSEGRFSLLLAARPLDQLINLEAMSQLHPANMSKNQDLSDAVKDRHKQTNSRPTTKHEEANFPPKTWEQLTSGIWWF
ncbi:hypothetical protein V3481_009365 [Fusarium oxysporum f. sp. vasinfectum]